MAENTATQEPRSTGKRRIDRHLRMPWLLATRRRATDGERCFAAATQASGREVNRESDARR